MTQEEEHREIVSVLLDIIDNLFATTQAQKAYLSVCCKGEWEGPVSRLLDAHASSYSAILAPFRDILLGAPDGTFPDQDWRRAVEYLVESAKPDFQRLAFASKCTPRDHPLVFVHTEVLAI